MSYLRRNEPIVTWSLIGINVVVYLITVAQGFDINHPGGKLFLDWALFGQRSRTATGGG